jgi:predicted lipoprotein
MLPNTVTTAKNELMKRTAAIIGGLVVLALLWWACPPLHIRSLKAVRAAQAGAQFNVTNFVTDFWRDKLLVAAERATEATTVLEAIAHNPQKAREQYGRSVEIGGTYYYFLRGPGRVVRVSDDSIGMALQPAGNVVDICVPLGLVFGNALRDGTGLLNASDYPNSQQYNDLAAGLNHVVETRVLPPLQTAAKVGSRVQFAGCAEVADEDQDLKPLKLVPIYVKIE